jgi:hypothetical protein
MSSYPTTRDERAARRAAEKKDEEEFLAKRRAWLKHLETDYPSDRPLPTIFRDWTFQEKFIEMGDVVYIKCEDGVKLGVAHSVGSDGAVVVLYTLRSASARVIKPHQLELKRKSNATEHKLSF